MNCATLTVHHSLQHLHLHPGFTPTRCYGPSVCPPRSPSSVVSTNKALTYNFTQPTCKGIDIVFPAGNNVVGNGRRTDLRLPYCRPLKVFRWHHSSTQQCFIRMARPMIKHTKYSGAHPDSRRDLTLPGSCAGCQCNHPCHLLSEVV